MLHRDAAAQRSNPVDVALADRLGMVEEPVEALKRDVAVDLSKTSSARLIVWS
jgi:hypothetical protein